MISTYGVIVAEEPFAAVAEMARVLRSRGRLSLATWADDPDSYIARFFSLIARWSDAPLPPASPFDWGRPDWLDTALSGWSEIAVRAETTTLYAPDTQAVWEEYVAGFGPVAATCDALPEARRAEFRRDFEDLHAPYDTGVGLAIPRQALLVRGIRH